MDMPPAFRDSFSMVFLDQAERRVPKLDPRSAVYFAQAILDIRNDRDKT